MKLITKTKILILIFVGIIFAFSPIINNWLKFNTGFDEKTSENNDIINLDNKNLQISAVSGKIHIDNNWSAAKSVGICTGQGTYSDPYVIKNLVINSKGLGNCIWIENSAVYFKIENCKLYNSGENYAGIELSSVNNSQIIHINCSSNDYGIRLMECNYNTISGNIVNYNTKYGIYLSRSENNTISGNIVNYNTKYGIYLIFSENNTISENMVNYNTFYGIYLDVSYYNNIFGNTISNNKIGMKIIKTVYAYWIPGCHDNTISGNNVYSNKEYGIIFYPGCPNNSVYLNCFGGNKVNAYDEGGNNYWDNGIKGNFWSNYTGLDEDGDGIGDIPYNINGYSGCKDNYPLMKCPISVQENPFKTLILITIISGGAVIGVAIILLIIRKRIQ